MNTSGIKYLGKVYTPKWVVDHMLQSLFDESLERVRVCDPACGKGDFLAPIVEEICKRMGSNRTRAGRSPCNARAHHGI